MNNRSHAFTLTGNTLGQNPVQANVGSVGSSPCNSDYLIIPCVSSKQGPVASGMNTCVDRLCGGTLNTDYSTIPTTVMSKKVYIINKLLLILFLLGMTLCNLLLYLYDM